MNAQMVAGIIQLILAPAVLATFCAILSNGLYGHYAAINERLRTLALERLGLIHSTEPTSKLAGERLSEIDRQAPELLRRHAMTRDVLIGVHLAVILFLACMFVIAAAVWSNETWIAGIALGVFLLGAALLLWSIALLVVELCISHRAVHYEMRRVLELIEE